MIINTGMLYVLLKNIENVEMYFTLGSIMSTVPEKAQDILSDAESIA